MFEKPYELTYGYTNILTKNGHRYKIPINDFEALMSVWTGGTQTFLRFIDIYGAEVHLKRGDIESVAKVTPEVVEKSQRNEELWEKYSDEQ